MQDAASLEHIAEPLRGLAIPIEKLVNDPANVRRHDERSIEALRGALQRFGQRAPLVVQKQGMVVRAGNARLEAARRLGWTHVAALVVDEGNVDATAFAISDNRTSDLSDFDSAALIATLEGLKADGFAIDAVGFTEDELAAMSATAQAPEAFPSVDSDLSVDFQCPRCGYAWSGQKAPAAEDADGDGEE